MVKPLTFKGDKKVKKRKREAEPEPAPNASDATEANDDTWVSADVVTDVAGPVLLVLPTSPPTTLACDANGSVFAMAIENMVDDNPSSAEPHDVRQVWVASRVGTDQFQFKGHHGRYLGCDKGQLSATAQAVSPIESFSLAEEASKFQLKTSGDTFVGVEEKTARGDLESSDSTLLCVRMQARFKPRLQQNKAEKAREKIGRRELEEAVGRRLEEDEVRRLKRARREGDYHEQLLMIKVKNKHDKFG